MTNASFFVYLFASCIGIAIIALLLLIFKVQARKEQWKNLLILFVAITFLLGLLYFGERYYTDSFETMGGWPAFVRAADLILASAQVFVWCWFLRAKAGLAACGLSLGTNIVLIGIFLVQLVIYLGLMDEHYFIASVPARTFSTAAYILFMILLTAVLVLHAGLIGRSTLEKKPKGYLVGISLLLLADLLWESFYVLMLFRADPILDRWLYQSFDLVSLSFLLINVLVAVYIWRCEISGVIPASPQQQEEEQLAARQETMRQAGLSEREIEVAQLLLDGTSYEEIARRLSISKYTVKRHAHNIYQKLEVTNKVDLIGRFR